MPILVTSASRKIPLLHSIARQVGRGPVNPGARVLAGDSDPECLAAFVWPDFWCMPALDDVGPEALVAALIEREVSLVIPTRDADVGFLATHRDVVEARGVHCLAPGAEAARLCLDKLDFARALEEHGLPAIPTSVEPSLASVESWVVKERRGAGSRGLVLGVSRAEAVATAASLIQPVFQPMMPGRELSIDAYRSRDGRLLGLVARTRDIVVRGESQVTTTVDPGPYEKVTRGVLDAIDFAGHAVIQVIEGPDGQHVVECNPRLGGGSTLALAAGLRSITWCLLEAVGDDPASVAFTPVDGPLRLVRIPQDVIDDPGL